MDVDKCHCWLLSKWFTVNTGGIILWLIMCLCEHVLVVCLRSFNFCIFVYLCVPLSVPWFRVICFLLNFHSCLYLNSFHHTQHIFYIHAPEITYFQLWNEFHDKLIWRKKGMPWFVQRFGVTKYPVHFFFFETTVVAYLFYRVRNWVREIK